MRLILADPVHPLVEELFRADGAEVLYAYSESAGACADLFARQEGGLLIRGRFSIDESWLQRAKKIRFIARFGAGMEHINVTVANQLGIKCYSSPEGNRDAVADHALGMLLMQLNRLHIVNAEVRQGLWIRESNRGTELGSLCVGIIGYGNMGSAFAQRLQGFGCSVLAYDPFVNISNFPSEKYRQIELQELFDQADVVSLHVPLNDQTKGMVDAEFLGSFKKPVWIINTSRGPVLSTRDLMQAIENGKVHGACLDVLDFEESGFEGISGWQENETWNKMVGCERIILSPHIAGWSHQSNEKMARILYQKIRADFHK